MNREHLPSQRRYDIPSAVQVPSILQGSLEVHLDEAVQDELERMGIAGRKTMRAMTTYGYIGGSRKGRNGIVDVNHRDLNIEAATERFLASEKCKDLAQRFGMTPERLQGVKVVAHIKSGHRLIGVMDPQANRAVFYAIANYAQ